MLLMLITIEKMVSRSKMMSKTEDGIKTKDDEIIDDPKYFVLAMNIRVQLSKCFSLD